MGIFSIFKTQITEIPTIKVAMLGPRGVGKTSVMASIFSESKKSIAGGQLYFRPSQDCKHAMDLNNKRLELMNVIKDRKSVKDSPNAGVIDASSEETEFKFELGLLGNPVHTVNLSMTDYPGEYVVSKPEKVAQYIEDSEVIILAIDTPYMLEENGKYNDEKNKPKKIIDFFLNHKSVLKSKLLLMVPLKCERYFHDGEIDSVTSKIEEVYSKLIEHCEKNDIACVIAPIQSMGGVEFDRFVDNSNPLSELSKISSFRFYDDNGPATYMPMFCVQPLYYVLTYVARYYDWNKTHNSVGFLNRLRSTLFSYLNKDAKFLDQIRLLSNKVITDGNGYKIVCDNTVFKIK